MARWQPMAVTGLPDGLILFDGVCVFCSRWVRFVIARDPNVRFRFLAMQTPEGGTLAAHLGINAAAPETNAVVLGGNALFKSDAALAVLSALRGWRWVGALRWVPRPLRDAVYDVIARNRYRIFGRTETCMMPDPGMERHVWRGVLPLG